MTVLLDKHKKEITSTINSIEGTSLKPSEIYRCRKMHGLCHSTSAYYVFCKPSTSNVFKVYRIFPANNGKTFGTESLGGYVRSTKPVAKRLLNKTMVFSDDSVSVPVKKNLFKINFLNYTQSGGEWHESAA